MTDLADTLAAIDELAVHECGQCQKPLDAGGPSRDFCSETCQTSWTRAKQQVTDLIGYREPVDLMYPEAAGRRPAGFAEAFQGDPRADGAAAAASRRLLALEWLALLAAPWHPDPVTLRPASGGRPPDRLNAVRRHEPRMWNPAEPVDPFGTAFTQDTYRLESVDEQARTAIYRIQGLPGPRYAVFRGWGHLPTWWLQAGWEGRWIEVEPGAIGHRWAAPSSGWPMLTAHPTERYETREDGAAAEVWEVRP